MDNDMLILRKEGAVARIVLNNPARLNAISVEMWDSLDRILDDVGDDRAIRVTLHTPASLSSSSRRRQGSIPHGHRPSDADLIKRGDLLFFRSPNRRRSDFCGKRDFDG